MQQSTGSGQSAQPTMRSFTNGLGERLKITKARASKSSTKDIDIAAMKATSSRFHVVPKEKHVVTLKFAAAQSMASYVASSLLQRLHDERSDWLTRLKTLITIHRLMREIPPDQKLFVDELVRSGDASHKHHRGGRVLAVDNFVDAQGGKGRYDYSEWVRAYGRYLDEQLEVYRTQKWRFNDNMSSGEDSILKDMPVKDLLLLMPELQRLQRRIVDCVPHGAASMDNVVMFSLSLVVQESYKLYKSLSQGLINLADTFFTLEYSDAARGLDIYREAFVGTESLEGFYSSLQGMNAVQSSMDLQRLQQLPADFISSMETYVKEEAPRNIEPGNANALENTAPLRKGRLLKNSSTGKDAAGSTTSYTNEHVTNPDPGMLLPLGTKSSVSAKESQYHIEEDEAPKEIPEPTMPVVDLLSFEENPQHVNLEPAMTDTNDVPVVTSNTENQSSETTKLEPTAMDLLAELDFGGSFDNGAGEIPNRTDPAQSAFDPFAISSGQQMTYQANSYPNPTINVPQQIASPTIDSASTPSTTGALGWATVSSPPDWHQEQQRIKEAGAMDHFADISAKAHPKFSPSPVRPASGR